MANIMINENCNQKCPYCFASEFINVIKNDITFDNFKKASDFILKDTQNINGRIGIIGGEPLLHPMFDSFINYLTERGDVSRVTVFTNGVLIDEHIDSLLSDKVGVLVNVNSAKDVGLKNYNKTINALDTLINKYRKKEITIGLNIYENQDYSFFVDLAKKFNMRRVRLSVVVPAYGKEKKGLSHFQNLKATVVSVAKALLVKDILFRFDCNLPVPCMWSDEELNDLKVMGLCTYSRELIPLEQSYCSPVIDILPDLTAIRCFGMSDVSKVDISKYESIEELRRYYIDNFDLPWSKTPIGDKCKLCKLFPNNCYGGCLANRQN